MTAKTYTVAQIVKRMIAEIKVDIAAGTIPKTVASFSELHDYVDANEYGGLCEDKIADALIEQFGGRDTDEGMPQGMLNFINDAQNTVDALLRSGKL